VPASTTPWRSLRAPPSRLRVASSTCRGTAPTTPTARWPRRARRRWAQGVTINGLAILGDTPLATNPRHTNPPGGLTAYYRDNVIGGPAAFVMEATGFDAFGQALIAKLIKEIADAGGRGRDASLTRVQ
jgi:hypothetical protein